MRCQHCVDIAYLWHKPKALSLEGSLSSYSELLLSLTQLLHCSMRLQYNAAIVLCPAKAGRKSVAKLECMCGQLDIFDFPAWAASNWPSLLPWHSNPLQPYNILLRSPLSMLPPKPLQRHLGGKTGHSGSLSQAHPFLCRCGGVQLCGGRHPCGSDFCCAPAQLASHLWPERLCLLWPRSLP